MFDCIRKSERKKYHGTFWSNVERDVFEKRNIGDISDFAYVVSSGALGLRVLACGDKLILTKEVKRVTDFLNPRRHE